MPETLFVACEATFLKTWCAIIVSNKSVRELYWSPKEVLHRSVWECIWWISEISELVWMDWREGSNMENSQRMCRRLYDFTLRTKSIIGEAYLWNLNKKILLLWRFSLCFFIINLVVMILLSQVQKQKWLNPRWCLGLSLFVCIAN